MRKITNFHKELRELKQDEEVIVISPKNVIYRGFYVFDTYSPDDYSPNGIIYISNFPRTAKTHRSLSSIEFYDCQATDKRWLEGVYVDVTNDDYLKLREKIEETAKENKKIKVIEDYHWGVHKTLGLVYFTKFFSAATNRIEINVYTDINGRTVEAKYDDFKYFCTDPFYEDIKNLPFMHYDGLHKLVKSDDLSIQKVDGEFIGKEHTGGIFTHIKFKPGKKYNVYYYNSSDSEGWVTTHMLYVDDD